MQLFKVLIFSKIYCCNIEISIKKLETQKILQKTQKQQNFRNETKPNSN